MSKNIEIYSDEEILNRSRSIQFGAYAQREAIAEAKRRGIFDSKAHLANSPMGQAIKSGKFPLPKR